MSNAFEKMDRMYRHQRYFYDFTRKYYLLGRDRLISKIDVNERDSILEVGCGTARNLIIMARKYPKANFFGIDASGVMLETAKKKIDALRIGNIDLRNALADEFSFDKTFVLENRFDAVYFSYSISMIPTWKTSISNALKNLKPGRSIFVVDFYDQRHLPNWFRWILKRWLRLFHVHYPNELIPYLEELEKDRKGILTVNSIYKSYSFIAQFEKP